MSANTSLPQPLSVTVVRVETALQMQSVVTDLVAQQPCPDVVVMAAAVADFRPKHYAAAKIKKTHEPGDAPDESAPVIELVRNPDILAGLVHARAGSAAPVIVGFAAETGDADGTVLDHGRAKMLRKGCDILVVNEVGVDKTFGQDDTTVHLLQRGSDVVTDVGPASKAEVSQAIWDLVQTRL